jgi:twitching motility protein PilT
VWFCDPVTFRGFDDDVVPSDYIGSAPENREPQSPAGLDASDADFVPADIFRRDEVNGATPAPDADHAIETETEPREPWAINPETEPQEPWVIKPETEPREPWAVKPFPVAPGLPPLQFTQPEPPVDYQHPVPEPAAPAAAPAPPVFPGHISMTRTTRRYELSQAGASEVPPAIDHLLRLAASLGASALYLSSNMRPSVRIDGQVKPIDSTAALDPAEIETLLLSLVLMQHRVAPDLLTLKQWSFELSDLGRVNCMTFRDRRGPGAVFLMAPVEKPLEERAGLHLDIQTLSVEREGLVVVAGPRDSGQQALISGLVDLHSRARQAYVITVQRGLSAPADGEGSLISQREAHGGLDEMLAVARAALQENPDVLVLQEVHSAPLMSLAFDAAASGVLVIAGLTAPSARAAIDRIVDLFPPEEARQVQLSLAHQLKGIVGQVLVPKIGGGRVAARELLLNTPAVSSVLAAGKGAYIDAAIAAGLKQGMVRLGDALVDLVQSGTVAAADAYRQSPDPVAFIDDLKRLGLDTSFVHHID